MFIFNFILQYTQFRMHSCCILIFSFGYLSLDSVHAFQKLKPPVIAMRRNKLLELFSSINPIKITSVVCCLLVMCPTVQLQQGNHSHIIEQGKQQSCAPHIKYSLFYNALYRGAIVIFVSNTQRWNNHLAIE